MASVQDSICTNFREAGETGRSLSILLARLAQPQPLPIKGIIQNGPVGSPRGFDISPDGKQFIVMVPAADSNIGTTQQQINVVVNWFTELKQRVGAKN